MYEILTVYVDENGDLGIHIEDKITDKFKNQEDLLNFLNGELIVSEVAKLLDETAKRVGVTLIK